MIWKLELPLRGIGVARFSYSFDRGPAFFLRRNIWKDMSQRVIAPYSKRKSVR